jgi:hypothetical protein
VTELLTVPDRDAYFWPKVKRSDGCWEWVGCRNNRGYGIFWIGNGRRALAHRYIFVRRVAPIPDGMDLCHRCDNPCCVNPGHLFLGTHSDNMRDMDRKGRRRSPRGETHPHSTLSDAAVAEIRARYVPGLNRWRRGNASELAVEYGTTRHYIAAIARGTTRAVEAVIV